MDMFLEYAVSGLVISATLYMVIHMVYNRIKGREEIEGLFKFKLRKKDKNTTDS
jgi:hypothetical protein